MAGLDDTVQSFPTYAELTQTRAWAPEIAPVRAELDEASRAADESRTTRYTEGAVLGVGGMGKVVLARDARIGRDVAVKVLHAERELAPDERARFLREAQVQGQLEHPSIVPVYDIDRRDDGTTFFTMRRVLGRTLAAILEDLRREVPAARARHTQRELLTAFATVCLTVDYAHSRGVVHRDLKPANIMLGDFGEVYVLDWGLARLVDDRGRTVDDPHQRLSMPGTMMGTPLYMAPEQMADPDVGPVADVYALGAILFEILTLEPLRDPNALYAPVEARPSVRAPQREVAPELETICVRATALDADARYPSARALHEALTRYLDGDRELEQRRVLAAEHGRAARAALERSAQPGTDAELERGTAMRELRSALAFDPGNHELAAMLGQILATPPATLPPEVHAQLRAETQRVIRSGASYSWGAMLSWFLFLPVMLAIGMSRVDELLVIVVPAAASATVGFISARQREISRALQLATIGFMMLASIGVSRIFGPMILMPTLITAYAIVLQAHPARSFRITGAVIAGIAIVTPVALELAGVIPASYAFDHGTWIVLPQLMELSRAGTVAFLTIANVAILVLPCVFVARLRRDLSVVQQRQLLAAWHFRRLGEGTRA